MDEIIGRRTSYHGVEHPYLRGHTVRIIAVIKGGAAPHDPDADLPCITDPLELARVGGVTAEDRVEVQPWLDSEGRFSFVASDPRAVDLACFAHLLDPTTQE